MRIDTADAERSATRVRAVSDLFGKRVDFTRARTGTIGIACTGDVDSDDDVACDFRRRSFAVTKPVLDRAQIAHVAELASLSLTTEEMDAMATELAAIVGYVDELEAVDTENVPPTAHVQLERAAWRRDAIEPSLTQEEALAQAPESAHGGFAVPVFVES